MIDVLIKKGDLFDAERFSEVTYSTLRDKKNGMDQEGEVMATSSYNLALVLQRQNGDLIRAEKLVREAFRIRTNLFGSDNHIMAATCDLLAKILEAQGKLGDETRVLYEQALAVQLKNQGPYGGGTAVGNQNIASFYYGRAQKELTVESKRTQLRLAKSHYEEAFRINLKVHGPTHKMTLDAQTRLEDVVSKLSCSCPIGMCDFGKKKKKLFDDEI